jgi:hypothetical protein
MGKDEEKWKAGQYNHYGTGPKVLVAFAGLGVKLPGAAAWAKALYERRLKGFGVGHVYGVIVSDGTKLPAELVPHFKDLDGDIPHVFVIGHSSGTGVAHTFLKLLDKPILDKTVYFNVDGGYNEGKDAFPAKAAPKKIFTVYAESEKGAYPSRNHAVMKTKFGFGAKPRKMTFPVPDKWLPKTKTPSKEELDVVKNYLHHRIVVQDPPYDGAAPFASTDKEYTDLAKSPQNVETGWIDDKDKDL